VLENIPDDLPFDIDEHGSNHASNIFRYPDVCKWFADNVVEPREWTLEHPDEFPPNALPLNISSYSSKFDEKGLKLWDINNSYYASVRLNLEAFNQSFWKSGLFSNNNKARNIFPRIFKPCVMCY